MSAPMLEAMPVTVRELRDDDRDRVDRYVASSPDSTLYHRTGWKDIVEDVFAHRVTYLLAEGRDDGLRGLLPMAHLRSRLFGNYFVSMPYVNYGGVCADDGTARDALLGEAVGIARRSNAEFVEFRQTVRLGNGMPVKEKKVAMTLALPPTSGELWDTFHSKVRSQIKRPQKEGLTFRVGGLEEVDPFYRVFSRNMRDLGTPVYPKRFFQAILRRFPESTWICTVYRDEAPLASGFLCGFKDRLEIPWASSLREFSRLSPNMLLYWGALRFGCEAGYKVFDFGRSTPGEGTYRFKEQWGAKPVPLYWHYWLRGEAGLPELNPSNRKYAAAIALWKRLPLAVANAVGPRIVRNLP